MKNGVAYPPQIGRKSTCDAALFQTHRPLTPLQTYPAGTWSCLLSQPYFTPAACRAVRHASLRLPARSRHARLLVLLRQAAGSTPACAPAAGSRQQAAGSSERALWCRCEHEPASKAPLDSIGQAHRHSVLHPHCTRPTASHTPPARSCPHRPRRPLAVHAAEPGRPAACALPHAALLAAAVAAAAQGLGGGGGWLGQRAPMGHQAPPCKAARPRSWFGS